MRISNEPIRTISSTIPCGLGHCPNYGNPSESKSTWAAEVPLLVAVARPFESPLLPKLSSTEHCH